MMLDFAVRPGTRGKVFLIVDHGEAPKAGQVQAWVAAHRKKIALFFLPAYAPEHHPDEFLHSEVKQHLGRHPATKDQRGSRAACAATYAGCSASWRECRPSFGRQSPVAA
jgi:hypothetical protein